MFLKENIVFFIGAVIFSTPICRKCNKFLVDKAKYFNIFDFNDYSKILIMPFDVSAVVLPDQSDNTYQPMVDVLNILQEYAADYLRKPLKKTPVIISAAKTLLPEPKTLAFNMKIDEFDPGNRALRA